MIYIVALPELSRLIKNYYNESLERLRDECILPGDLRLSKLVYERIAQLLEGICEVDYNTVDESQDIIAEAESVIVALMERYPKVLTQRVIGFSLMGDDGSMAIKVMEENTWILHRATLGNSFPSNFGRRLRI